MDIAPHPLFPKLRARLEAALEDGMASSFAGAVYRFVSLRHASPEDIISGVGGYRTSSRWMCRGQARLVHTSLSPEVATSEAFAYARLVGIPESQVPPRLLVSIEASLSSVLDLTDQEPLKQLGVPASELISKDWDKRNREGEESLTQAIGRSALTAGYEAILAASAQVSGGRNLFIFPAALRPESFVRVLGME